VLWLALLACIVIPAENRNRRAWLILVPLVAVLAIWGMLRQLLSGGLGSQISMFDQMVLAIAVATAALSVLSGRLVSLRRTTRFFTSLLILVAVGVLSTWSYGGLSSRETIPLLVVHSIWAVSLLVAIVINRFFCRKRMTGRRFGLMLFLWMVVLFICSMFAAALVDLGMRNRWWFEIGVSVLAVVSALTFLCHRMVTGTWFRSMLLAWMVVAIICGVVLAAGISASLSRGFDGLVGILLLRVPFIGLIMGVISYAFVVPYTVLAFKSGFYRTRLLGCLGLSEPAAEAAAEPDTQGGAP
jgi:hypothetical protein